MRIWAKIMCEDKIIRDTVCEKNGKPTKKLIEDCLRILCEQIDIPCPLVLGSHYSNFLNFSTTKFLPTDFVESVDFECLIIENITED